MNAKCAYCGRYGPLGSCLSCGGPNAPAAEKGPFNCRIGDVIRLSDVLTHDPSTEANVDADSTPTFSVYRQEDDRPILTAQYKQRSTMGHYGGGTFMISTANGFKAGESYLVIDSATVSGVAARRVSMHLRVAPS